MCVSIAYTQTAGVEFPKDRLRQGQKQVPQRFLRIVRIRPNLLDMKHLATVILLSVLALLAGSWAARAAADPFPPIRVASSIPPLGALVRVVGGDLVQVQVLLPPGASPHGYEPGPEAIRNLARAEVHFVIGRGLDGWAESLARGANPDARIERLGQSLPGPEPPADPDDVQGDPHVWLDPVKAAAMVLRIGEVLVSLRPGCADTLHRQTAAAVEQLHSLDKLCGERLAPIREVPFVAFHGGLNHLVARYGLRQVGVLEPFPGREPSPKYLKKIIARIRETGARVVFAEPQLSARLAEVVARESGVPVVEIDPIGGLPGRMTYDELIRSDLDVLTRALGADR